VTVDAHFKQSMATHRSSQLQYSTLSFYVLTEKQGDYVGQYRLGLHLPLPDDMSTCNTQRDKEANLF